MKRTVRRLVATGAVAPFAFLAVAAPAGAAVAPEPVVGGGGPGVLVFPCLHPLITDLTMEVKVTLEGGATPAPGDEDDIDEVAVELADPADFRPESIAVEYFDDNYDDDSDIDDSRNRIFRDYKRLRHTEDAAEFRGRDNVGYVRVTGAWTGGPGNRESETLSCSFPIPLP